MAWTAKLLAGVGALIAGGYITAFLNGIPAVEAAIGAGCSIVERFGVQSDFCIRPNRFAPLHWTATISEGRDEANGYIPLFKDPSGAVMRLTVRRVTFQAPVAEHSCSLRLPQDSAADLRLENVQEDGGLPLRIGTTATVVTGDGSSARIFEIKLADIVGRSSTGGPITEFPYTCEFVVIRKQLPQP